MNDYETDDELAGIVKGWTLGDKIWATAVFLVFWGLMSWGAWVGAHTVWK